MAAGVATMSRTPSRRSPRCSGGSVAVRSSGKLKWVSGRAASMVLTATLPSPRELRSGQHLDSGRLADESQSAPSRSGPQSLPRADR